jgi:hypothetical protein
MTAEADAKLPGFQKFADWPYIGQSALVGLLLPLCIHVILSVVYSSGGPVNGTVNDGLNLMYLVPVWQVFLLIKHMVEKVVSGAKSHTLKRLRFVLSALGFSLLHVALISLSGMAFGYAWGF